MLDQLLKSGADQLPVLQTLQTQRYSGGKATPTISYFRYTTL